MSDLFKLPKLESNLLNVREKEHGGSEGRRQENHIHTKAIKMHIAITNPSRATKIRS
jgi:hypothetical protein